MKKCFILLLTLSLLVANAAAQENGSASKKLITNISLNTGNKLGHLVYTEFYYSVNGSGYLTFDTGRTFFNGNITSSRIRIQIIRPYDSQGNPYPDNRIRAIATLDNKTILDGFYKVNKPANVNVTATGQAEGKKSPGFEFAAAGAVLVLAAYCISRRKNL